MNSDDFVNDGPRLSSWNPFRFQTFAYEGEGSGSGAAAAGSASASGSPPASTSGDGSAGGEAGGAPDGFSDGNDPFEGLDLDSVEIPEDVTGTDPGAPPPEVKEPVAAAPVKPAVPEAKPPVPPVTPEPVVGDSSASSAPRSAREELDAAFTGFKDNQEALTDWASKELFTLTPAEIEALDTNASEAIPRLMARSYTQAMMAATNMIRNFVPQMISQGVVQQQAASSKASEALTEFYAANKHLNAKDHGDAVVRWAKMFRAANPKASRADAIKFVGTAVSTELGIAPGAAPPAKASPFAPARPGGRPSTTPASDGNDPYAGLDQDFLDVE